MYALKVPAAGWVTTTFWSARMTPPPTGMSAALSDPDPAEGEDDAGEELDAATEPLGELPELAAAVDDDDVDEEEAHAAVTAAPATMAPPASSTVRRLGDDVGISWLGASVTWVSSP